MANRKQEQRPMGGPRRGPGGPGGRMGMMPEKPQNAKATLGKLIRYIGRSKYLVLALALMVSAIALCSLFIPMFSADAIDAMTLLDPAAGVDWPRLQRSLLLIAAMAVIFAALSYVQTLLVAHLSNRTVRALRGDLFQKIVYLPLSYTDTHPHGDIMSRMTNDVENISNSISGSLTTLISGAITLVGTLAIMLWYSPLLTLISLASVVLTVICTGFLTGAMRKYFPLQQRLLGQLNGHIEEMVTGYRTVTAYSHEDAAQREFDAISHDLRNAGMKAEIIGGAMGPLMTVIGNLGYLLVAAFGGWMALQGAITVGVIQAFLTYTRQFNRPINEMAQQYASIQTALAGAERVFAILDTPNEVDEGTQAIDTDAVRGHIEFRNIHFSYVPDEPVIRDLSLTVQPGQKIAIVGATGSGKTTIVNLLTRFYDPQQGTILLDGVDVRDIPKQTLRSIIAIVLQDTVIFSDTVGNNIRYGNLQAGDAQVQAAAHTARVDSFVHTLPQGYDTPLSEGGGNLSQGQRQLISIARAVLADPRILILDEATSSIDTRTEMHIQEAMLSLMKGRTSLIIAHRLSTIRDADAIVVIDHGRVVELGDHDTLLAQKGVYHRLYQSQFAGIAT